MLGGWNETLKAQRVDCCIAAGLDSRAMSNLTSLMLFGLNFHAQGPRI
jgi:hypothetical protein